MVLSFVIATVTLVIGAEIGWLVAQNRWSERVFRLELAEDRAVSQKNTAIEERDREKSRREEVEALNNRLVSELASLAARPPHVIDPSATVRAIGEAIASAYGPPAVHDSSTPIPPDYERTPDFSKLQPSTTTTDDQRWFPDVEMDSWLEDMGGFPTRGGWVNRQTNSQVPPPEGQHPVHRLLENGGVERVDSQPMFRAGDGQVATPPGGIE